MTAASGRTIRGRCADPGLPSVACRLTSGKVRNEDPLGVLQMPHECPPIPENLVQAFRQAAGEFKEWRKFGGPETHVVLDGKSHSIGRIAELASEFGGSMPDDIFEFLRMIGGFGGEPTQNTFAAGGPFLKRVYTEHQHLLAKRQE